MRADFGAAWADVIRYWCLGSEPAEPPFTAWLALEALDRWWPEYVDGMIASPIRGLLMIVSAIHLGTVLRSCEHLVGFDAILRRVRLGEQGALTELVVAANLVSLGYQPELEPAVGASRLDAVVTVDGTPVYIEVISPERSEVMIEAHASIQALATRVRTENPARKIEVLLNVDVSEEVATRVCAFVSAAPLSADVQDIPAIGAATIEPADRTMVIAPRIQAPADVTVLGAASGSSDDGSVTSVRMPITDHRVQRLLDGELHHFSRADVNLLAIDVSRSAGSIRGWSPLIERRFQPNLNRRLGAVVVFQVEKTTPAIGHQWRAFRNPHALRPVPEALLTALESLNG